MRTRNQSGMQGEDPHRALSDISREAVRTLLNRKGKKRKKQDSYASWPDYENVPEESRDNTLTPGPVLLEEEVDKGSSSYDFPENKQDASDSEWEDGFIPMPHSGDCHENNVVVEFYDSPSTAKKKSVRRATAEEKELAELIHKLHLLCLLARGRLVDNACNDPLIQGALLSLLPSHLLNISDHMKLTANALAPVVKWFHDNFTVECSDLPERSFKSCLAAALEKRKGTSEEVAALSVALFRALNLTTRFVSVLDVASLKPVAEGSGSFSQDVTGMDPGIFGSSTMMVTKPRRVSASPVQSSSQKASLNGESSSINGVNDTVCDASGSKTHTVSSEACQIKAEGSKRKGDLEYELQLEMAVFATAAGISSKKNLSSELKDLPSGSSCISSPPNKLKRFKIEEASHLSQGISTAVGSRKVGAPFHWAEIFCGGENLTGKWVHVDAVNSLIGCEEKVEAGMSACKRILRYAVAFAGNGAKDVTRRYCKQWYTIASKRVSSPWWNTVLAPLKELELRESGGVIPTMEASKTSSIATRSSLEDMELQTRSLTEPLPRNQQAYRNHHLYAIEKWLTKYEILRPKGPILGYCSGHPVYPRTCVQTLQTKQRWLREGLQIIANESPAKVLNSPKRGKAKSCEPGVSKEGDGEGTFALYGKWQTEPLDLPRAVDGIVPKNERGQVDVWSEKCLPHGTVHLNLPRVFAVAKRLEIDFAPAMVGFDFRSGRAIPVYQGIVVCSEFKDAIIEAYSEEERKRAAEEKKRNEMQAISRWYQLVSSIVTRQRLEDTYGDGSTQDHVNHKEESSNKNHGVSAQGLNNNEGSHVHVFPIEEQSFDEGTSVRTKRCPCGFSVEVEEM